MRILDDNESSRCANSIEDCESIVMKSIVNILKVDAEGVEDIVGNEGDAELETF